MYSPHSPTLSGGTFAADHHSFAGAPNHMAHHQYQHHHHDHHSPNSAASSGHHHIQQLHHQSHFAAPYLASFSTTSSRRTTSNMGQLSSSTGTAEGSANTTSAHHFGQLQPKSSVQCLRFKYFTTFFVCTTCLVLLAASLATHKWLVSRPIRHLRLNNGQRTNLTALMLTLATQDQDEDVRPRFAPAVSTRGQLYHSAAQVVTSQEQQQQTGAGGSSGQPQTTGNKFQGEIYFGLFSGVKVLNYGFGDRVSQLSVVQAYSSQPRDSAQVEPLVNFKFWLLALTGVALAILFALVGSIFAIINFVMTPRGTMTGPAGLVIWNAAACFSCLVAIFAWLAEYFLRLKSNVLTTEEIQNGWTSENRSHFGYSYYLVVLAFVLHLVNIFLVSIVQADTWTNSAGCGKAAKRQARSACDGVIMLY